MRDAVAACVCGRWSRLCADGFVDRLIGWLARGGGDEEICGRTERAEGRAHTRVDCGG